MKATGIVRRIDSSVIIGARVKALKTRGALDFCPISYIPRTVIRQPFFGNNAVKGEITYQKGVGASEKSLTPFAISMIIRYLCRKPPGMG